MPTKQARWTYHRWRAESETINDQIIKEWRSLEIQQMHPHILWQQGSTEVRSWCDQRRWSRHNISGNILGKPSNWGSTFILILMSDDVRIQVTNLIITKWHSSSGDNGYNPENFDTFTSRSIVTKHNHQDNKLHNLLWNMTTPMILSWSWHLDISSRKVIVWFSFGAHT